MCFKDTLLISEIEKEEKQQQGHQSDDSSDEGITFTVSKSKDAENRGELGLQKKNHIENKITRKPRRITLEATCSSPFNDMEGNFEATCSSPLMTWKETRASLKPYCLANIYFLDSKYQIIFKLDFFLEIAIQ